MTDTPSSMKRKAASHGDRLRGLLKRNRKSPVFICEVTNQSIEGILLQPEASESRLITAPVVLEDDGPSFTLPRRTSVFVVLPKQVYLTRLLTLPSASPGELAEMIRLQAEASLPANYGPVEVSYRQIATVDTAENLAAREEDEDALPTSITCEVYLVRSAIVERVLNILQSHNINPTCILPSAVIWDQALRKAYGDSEGPDDLLVAAVGGGRYETAHLGFSQAVTVRDYFAGSEHELQRGMIESLHAFTSEQSEPMGSLTIGYLGDCPPPVHHPRQIRMIDRSDFLGWQPSGTDDTGVRNATVALAAGTWDTLGKVGQWRSANLLPRFIVEASAQKQMNVQIVVGGCGFLAALLLVLAALHIATWRLQAKYDRLEPMIARISADGETVGHRLEQLQAVAEARSTRDDFTSVIAGLHEVSDGGHSLSYSQVDLREDGTVLLRGQATSLALPFELPQKLEALPTFANVGLRDAGQAKKGTGSITEFRIEAEHRRGTGP